MIVIIIFTATDIIIILTVSVHLQLKSMKFEIFILQLMREKHRELMKEDEIADAFSVFDVVG